MAGFANGPWASSKGDAPPITRIDLDDPPSGPGSTTTSSAARTTSPPTARRATSSSSCRRGTREGVRAHRAFLRRAVRHLAGRGRDHPVPGHRHRHPHAGQHPRDRPQAINPKSRAVYVDNDPIVLVHGRALLTSSDEGMTTVIEADLRDPDSILGRTRRSADCSTSPSRWRSSWPWLSCTSSPTATSPPSWSSATRRAVPVRQPAAALPTSPSTSPRRPPRTSSTKPYDKGPASMVPRTHAQVGEFFRGRTSSTPAWSRSSPGAFGPGRIPGDHPRRRPMRGRRQWPRSRSGRVLSKLAHSMMFWNSSACSIASVWCVM